jgi:hypothetical protein
MIDPLERLKTIRNEVWIIIANGAWGDGKMLTLAERIYTMCVEVVGKEPNDKRPIPRAIELQLKWDRERMEDMMAYLGNTPPDLYNALKAEGFRLPDECVDVQLVTPVDGLYQIRYVCNLTHVQLQQIGRALAKIGADGEDQNRRIAASFDNSR